MLTERQSAILHFIQKTVREERRPPTVREIQEHFGFRSPHAVTCHLEALEAKKAIRRERSAARGIFLAEYEEEGDVLPIFGHIPAGLPTDQEEHREGTLRIDLKSLGIRSLLPAFALRVTGSSMIGAGILDQDIVILQAREPKEGEVVAALVDGQTTLKRYMRKKGRPCLQAENPDYPDILPADELLIQGVMVALVRKAA